MKLNRKILFSSLGSLLLGYLIAVICTLLIFRGVTQRAEVLEKYSGEIETIGGCPEYQEPAMPLVFWHSVDYGVVSTGFPLVDNYNVIYPCGENSTTESKSFFIENPKGAFYLNMIFWSIIVFSGGVLVTKLKSRKK